MCLRKIPTRLRYHQAGILRGHTWESLKHYFKTVELDKIELAREGREPTREFHYTKFGLESRERSIGAAGVTLSPINPPLHQTKQTGRRHPGNELTFSSFVESEKRCHRLGRRPFVEEIGGVKLRPHGGLISRRGTDILPQIFLRPPTLPGKFCWIMRFGALGAPASPLFNGFSPLLARFSLILGFFTLCL
jgi:hypothetical protein